jgi:hypothetical protein
VSDRITYIDTITVTNADAFVFPIPEGSDLTPWLVIDPGADNEETVEIIAKSGNRLTVIRGVG